MPLIARAITIPEAPSVIHTPGTVLDASRGIFALSATDNANLLHAAAPFEAAAIRATPLYKPQNGPQRHVLAANEEEMLAYIKHRESSGNPTAQNPESSAYGLYGFLDSTWETVGCTKTSDPIEQERCALLYMEQRYGGIKGAYRFHLANDWY